jgi:predicted nucleic acid-binding protein
MAKIIPCRKGPPSLPSVVYFDTSALFAAYVKGDKFHRPAAALFASVMLMPSKTAAISPLVLSECSCALIRKEDKAIHGQPRAVRDVKRDHGFLRSCRPVLERFFRYIEASVQRGKIVMLDNPGSGYKVANEAIVKHTLLPNDALHYASVKHAGVDAIVTADSDFDSIKDRNLVVFSLLR